MSLTKTFFHLFSNQKSDKVPESESYQTRPKISRDELREFLINNNLQGDLLRSVTELKKTYTDLTNYQAVEFLMDHNDKNNH